MHFADQCLANQQPECTEPTAALNADSQVDATIALLQQRLEEVRRREIKHTRGRLGELNGTQVNAIESLSRGIIDQILRAPVSVLKAVNEDGSFALIQTVHRIFDLDQASESEK